MSIAEDGKKLAEQITGVGRPDADEIALREVQPEEFMFRDDGETPNNPQFPFLVYRQAVVLDGKHDPAAIFEELFASNGWGKSWRNSIYDFLHFHTHTHEVLGIARGSARVQFGGKYGPILDVRAGDVIVHPAGTGHERIGPPDNLLVVGAYPLGAGGGSYDEPEPEDISVENARRAIQDVPAPQKDPVYGSEGPLVRLWR
ncbi:MAG: cupin [Rhizomicrobium sp.]